MKAIILAAGQGTRLQSVEPMVPKPMVKIGGKPALERTLQWMASTFFDIHTVVITIGRLGRVIRSHFVNRNDLNILYSIEREPLGTGGGIRKAMKLISDRIEPVLIWYGDNLCNLNIQAMRKAHDSRGSDVTMAITTREEAWKSGVVVWDAPTRTVQAFHEHMDADVWRSTVKSHWISAGIYIVKPSLLRKIPDGVSDFGKDILPKWLMEGVRVDAYPLGQGEELHWYDTPEELERLRAFYASN